MSATSHHTADPVVNPVDPRRWRRATWDEPGTIYFYSGIRGPHRAFSNFEEDHPFRMPCWLDRSLTVEMPSGEHGFQTAKGPTLALFFHILSARGPMAAKLAGRRDVPYPADWPQRRTRVMLAVVRAKFATGELRELLDSTGERILAEDSPRDDLWGCRDRRGGYRGQNLLGRALMRVRDENRGLILP